MRVVPAILAAVLSLVPLSAAAQRRVTPVGPFVKARAIECAFTTYGVASSTMVLAGSSIKLSFKLVDKKGTTASSISFRKS